jgi:hypothetical protein
MEGASSAATVPDNVCQGHDPYTLRDAQIEQCGGHSYPLSTTYVLPYGGTAYVYQLEGMKATYLVPPASFDAATASSQELAAFGYPARPSASSPEYASWMKVMETSHPEAPKARLVVIPGAKRTTSRFLVGRYDATSLGSEFTQAGGFYVEPTEYETSCGGATADPWVGLQGPYKVAEEEGEYELVQDGTEIGEWTEFEKGEEWWEVLPYYPVSFGSKALPGRTVLAQINKESETLYRVFITSEEGETHAIYLGVYDAAYGGTMADYLVEAVGERPLENYHEIPWNAWTDGLPIGSPLLYNASFEMWRGTHNLADAGEIFSESLFVDYHFRCS